MRTFKNGNNGAFKKGWFKRLSLEDQQAHCDRVRLMNMGNTYSLGTHPSDETRKKLSKAHENRIVSQATRDKISKIHKGKIVSEETKELLRRSHLGKKASEETKALLSKQRMGHKLYGNVTGPNNPMFGKHHSEEAKRNISEKNKGKRLGIPLTDTTKEKLRKKSLGKKFSKEHCDNIRKAKLGMKLSEEAKKNLSKSLKGNPKVIAHLSTIWTKIPKITKPQKELYLLLKQMFSDATLEYPVKTVKSFKFADIGIPSLKLDFEYDGYFQHGRHTPEENKKRDVELAEVGWLTCRINAGTLKTLSQQPQFILLRNEPK